MKLLRPLWLAIGLYSRIPAPKAEWDERGQKAALFFLPVIGVVIGGLMLLWRLVCVAFDIGSVMFAAVAVVIPIVITGGFHLDGYCDTADALNSYQPKERALEIMKDARVGAFAAIRLCAYLLLNFAVLHELKTPLFAVIYALSRIYAVMSVYAMPKAKREGLVPNYAGSRAVLAILCAAFPPAIWYYRLTKRRFGGVTGDTSGYFVQVSELILLFGVYICERFI